MARIVVITGGGTGMGRAVASRLSGEGDRVVIIGRRKEVLEKTTAELTGDVLWRRCDVADPDQVQAFVTWLLRDVSAVVDVLVNNAGGTGSLPTEAGPRDHARFALEMLATNLVGAYVMTRALLPHIRKPGGRIVNVSSIAAFRGGGDMYSAAKAGLVGLTYSLARELAPEGITVNAIAPGLVLGTEFFGAGIPEERRQRIIAETPAARSGEPADIAAAVRYLASPEASFVTGQVLHVNGGQVFGR